MFALSNYFFARTLVMETAQARCYLFRIHRMFFKCCLFRENSAILLEIFRNCEKQICRYFLSKIYWCSESNLFLDARLTYVFQCSILYVFVQFKWPFNSDHSHVYYNRLRVRVDGLEIHVSITLSRYKLIKLLTKLD